MTPRRRPAPAEAPSGLVTTGTNRLIDIKAPAPADLAPVETGEARGAVAMFERLARDQTVDVAKLQALIDAYQRLLHLQAKAAFDGAFAAMQGELPVIAKQGEILAKDGHTVVSRYSTFEDIQAAIRPVLLKHGFSIRHRHRHLEDGRQLVVGILTHAGHSEEDEFVSAPDKSGFKNDIQAIGSTRKYGERYTTIALLNLEQRGVDDDGQAAGEVVNEGDQLLAGVSEGTRDALERAFAILKFTPGRRIQKLRAHVTAPDVEGSAITLLEALRDEFAAQQARPRAARQNTKAGE